MDDNDKDRELSQRMSNARTVMSAARMGIRQTEKDIRRFDELEKAYKFVREYGADITVTVRFGASAVGGHEEAAEVTRAFLLGDWNDVRRQLIEDIQREMLEISERCT
ncbi:hypothetical protein FDH38_gp115 [Dinoroseobacter phage vB_DshS-R5C]|uniref:Uncharacterized protein n=1 Tax=Dinoroseobacter phage vB_DshS-R5C TaxID=1965368 RepID=A0A1V0DYE7_9CAUD|nr:hypothetical protein FDH38_gp115 [Dinoroseobacter phage vB_DshS-R5C]ARB06169.1 hypothetical protein vBDshSR5C_115 [Dinoroseobacter phage vB_DshS-R5C]